MQQPFFLGGEGDVGHMESIRAFLLKQMEFKAREQSPLMLLTVSDIGRRYGNRKFIAALLSWHAMNSS